jgi:hypothetical protein
MKSLLLVSSFLVVSIASLLSPSEINVTFDSPSSVSVGETFIMDIEINKGDISDFAKLQLSLPEGFTAELFEGKEGTFTFYDQKIKLIWISLPPEEKFNVKIKIGCDTSLVGDYTFKGKISYVLEGERKNKELTSPTITINQKPALKSPTIASNKINTELTSGNSASTNTTKLSCTRSFDAVDIKPGETFLVTLTVEKSNVSGVGKIIENIPDGFTAQETTNNGAIFSQKGNEVKFLWMTLPSDKRFTVSYKVMVDKSIDGNKVIDGKMSYLNGDITKETLIDGTSIKILKAPQQKLETSEAENNNQDEKSTYTEDEKYTQESKTNNDIASNQIVKSQNNKAEPENKTPILTNDEGEKSDSDNTLEVNEKNELGKIKSTDEDISTSSKINSLVEQKENAVDDYQKDKRENIGVDNNEDSETDNITSISTNNSLASVENEKTKVTNMAAENTKTNFEVKSNHKVNYRVQICALRKQIPTTYFVKNHNIKENIYLNMHKGWHKYTVGDFEKYMSARQHRGTAKDKYKINGSFVTAYNDGSRITVQEALMITKDKWIAP